MIVTVNGHPHEPGTDAPGSLIGWLRGTLGLTGTKPGCGEGECGACTVLVDGVPVLSCQTTLAEVAGAAVTTIEGLAAPGRLHPVQRALVEERASQCGYCTPGMALRIAALVETEPDPDDERISAALGPNLCRCGCYPRLRRAVHRAATLRRSDGNGTDDGNDGSSPAEEGPGIGTPTGPAPLPRPRRPWDLSRPEDRDYLAVLGPGLVSVWPAAVPAPGGWAANGGAWVHVSPTGSVTAFSGKVDVGQDNRTAFRLLVAEELGVPFEGVRVVEGDTDLCPFDIGTFASRSMPDSGEPLCRAAAGAREALRDIGGAEQLGAWGRLGELDAEPVLVGPVDRHLVGRSGHEVSRLDVVTGHRRYISDMTRPGMLHGAVLRPRVPGSTLRTVDLGPAAGMAGVIVVDDRPFIGLAAEDPVTARRAVGALEARWDEPAPIDEDLAAYLRSHPSPGEGWQQPVDEQDGDVEGELGAAVTTLAATYSTAYLAHVPLETRAALAEWEDGRLTVWTGTQVPFGVRKQVAASLGMAEEDVRVIVPPTGGAFGGKHGGEVATEAARLARAAGRPVKVHWSRAEELQWGTLRPMAVIDIRAGLDGDGALGAWDFLDINAGPAALGLPYRTTATRLRYQPADSPLRQGSYRALAANANNFARESAIDELAHAAGVDPLAFRLAQLTDDRLVTVLRSAAEAFGWAFGPPLPPDGPASGARTGRGLAVGLEKGGRVATCAEVSVEPDGRVRARRLLTAYECGTVVNRDTVVNQIEGAMAMALGGAMFEAVPVEHGRFAGPSLANYPVPRFDDILDLEVLLLDRPDLPSAGAGETPMIAVAPALANAVFAATGRRLRDLPLVPGGRLP